jgi:hypothetical protein
MKIRADFVTNSSSVSYIIIMSKPMVDIYRKQHSGNRTSEKILIDFLCDDLLKNGTEVWLQGETFGSNEILSLPLIPSHEIRGGYLYFLNENQCTGKQFYEIVDNEVVARYSIDMMELITSTNQGKESFSKFINQLHAPGSVVPGILRTIGNI